MKLPGAARGLARRVTGSGASRPIQPEELHELAKTEHVVTIGVGNVFPGPIDPRLPGEHRRASLLTLADVVRDLPPQQAIALHCG